MEANYLEDTKINITFKYKVFIFHICEDIC